MLKTKAPVLLAFMMVLVALLSACGEEEVAFEGENTIAYDVGDSFTVNVKDETKIYVYCKVVVDLIDEAFAATLEAKNHWVRDIVIETLRAKSMDELKRDSATTDIGAEIAGKLSEKFNTTAIYSVEFTDYYIR